MRLLQHAATEVAGLKLFGSPYVNLTPRRRAMAPENPLRHEGFIRDDARLEELCRGDFVRHGGGVRFSEQGSARQVDVLDRVDRPDLFDRWRLVTYFGSLRRTGIKLLEHATPSPARRTKPWHEG